MSAIRFLRHDGRYTIPKQGRQRVGQDTSGVMNYVIEPGLLTLHETGWETQQVCGLFDLAECTYHCQRDDTGQTKVWICPPSLRRGDAAGQTTVDKKDHGQPAGDCHDLEVLDIQITGKRAVRGSCQETQGRVSEDRRPSRIDVGKEVAKEPEHADRRERDYKQETPGWT